eukprot:15470862-Alexandrium_andersonii.AAC.1
MGRRALLCALICLWWAASVGDCIPAPGPRVGLAPCSHCQGLLCVIGCLTCPSGKSLPAELRSFTVSFGVADHHKQCWRAVMYKVCRV